MPEQFDSASKKLNNPPYSLRPELIESTYLLYRATKNPYYQEVGASMLQDIESRMKTSCGYASVRNVHTGELSDRMESFFLAETLKYFYLLFDEGEFLQVIVVESKKFVDNFLHKTDMNWVFSTGNNLIPNFQAILFY